MDVYVIARSEATKQSLSKPQIFPGISLTLVLYEYAVIEIQHWQFDLYNSIAHLMSNIGSQLALHVSHLPSGSQQEAQILMWSDVAYNSRAAPHTDQRICGEIDQQDLEQLPLLIMEQPNFD